MAKLQTEEQIYEELLRRRFTETGARKAMRNYFDSMVFAGIAEHLGNGVYRVEAQRVSRHVGGSTGSTAGRICVHCNAPLIRLRDCPQARHQTVERAKGDD